MERRPSPLDPGLVSEAEISVAAMAADVSNWDRVTEWHLFEADGWLARKH